MANITVAPASDKLLDAPAATRGTDLGNDMMDGLGDCLLSMDEDADNPLQRYMTIYEQAMASDKSSFPDEAEEGQGRRMNWRWRRMGAATVCLNTAKAIRLS